MTETVCEECGRRITIGLSGTEYGHARGQHKYVQSCDACADDYRETPRGLYDPVVIGYTDGAEYTFVDAEDN